MQVHFYQESKYGKNAVSPSRTAFGIAQLTPGAVKSVGRDPRTFNYYDPQAAIDAGAVPKEKYPWWGEINAHLQQVFRGRPDYFDR